MARGRAFIGTSGWSYRHWRGPFYPEALSPKRHLEFYAERFDTVEVNGTFYRLIGRDTLAAWREQTPQGFVFACKGSRFLTHMKRLTDCGQGLERYFERVSALEEKLGPILFQLPAHFRPHPERLAEFLDCLPKRRRYAFEFRDPAWFTAEVLALLRRRNAALCLYEFAGQEAPLEITADFVYIRLHGPDGPYQGSYGEPALEAWAKRLDAWRRRGHDIYCYFDNDQAGYAPQNALQLKQLLGLGL
jgi:uncharacterized protein YecE (DUF72 family)